MKNSLLSGEQNTGAIELQKQTDEPWTEDERSRIIETFYWDLDAYKDYYNKYWLRVSFCSHVFGLLCIPCCCIPYNVRDQAHAQYLAVTEHEILYVRKQVKRCWRLDCCDAGEVRMTIPLDRVQDIRLRAPAGGFCPKQALYTVDIQTAGYSGPEAAKAELLMVGLQNPQRFVEVVKQQKRAFRPSSMMREVKEVKEEGGEEAVSSLLKIIEHGVGELVKGQKESNRIQKEGNSMLRQILEKD